MGRKRILGKDLLKRKSDVTSISRRHALSFLFSYFQILKQISYPQRVLESADHAFAPFAFCCTGAKVPLPDLI
jgi:hypothetical protein